MQSWLFALTNDDVNKCRAFCNYFYNKNLSNATKVESLLSLYFGSKISDLT